MTAIEWERLKALFHGALEQTPDTRHQWLIRQAGGDERMAREAAALVVAHETAGDFLETPATVDPADLAEPPPDDDREDAAAGGASKRIGQYEIEREIGRGGMSVVYSARDLRLHRRVALKALPTLHGDNTALRERLRREARAAATISHASVATVYALEEIDGRLFIASELVEGHTLRHEIERGTIAPKRALAIAADIVRALCAAHDAGVVHRDLKPENVLIATSGAVKVVDFGIAQIEHAKATRLTRPGAALGTPAYMAPEQLIGGAIDARTDIYALGVVLTEMLTGVHPLARDRQSTSAQPSDIAQRCMQIEPGARFQSAQDLLAAIEGEMGASPSGGHGSRWWWEFHQAAAALVYGVMTWPAWIARDTIGGAQGNAIFVAVLAGAIVADTLRLHLWFTSRFYPDELPWARLRTAPWVFVADCVFAVSLIAGGAMIGETRPALAVLHIAVGIGVAVVFLLVEPATARAAFRPRASL